MMVPVTGAGVSEPIHCNAVLKINKNHIKKKIVPDLVPVIRNFIPITIFGTLVCRTGIHALPMSTNKKKTAVEKNLEILV